MLNKIKSVLDKHGLTYYVPEDKEGNINLNCPFCEEDRQRFGVRIDNGMWNCFNCGIKSLTLESLDKKLTQHENGDLETRKPVPKEEEEEEFVSIDPKIVDIGFKKIKDQKRKSLRYVRKERGFSANAIKHFRLGSKLFKDKSGNAHEYLIVPYIEDQKVVNVKYRTVEPCPTDSPESKKNWKKFKWRREKGGKSVLFNGDCITKETDELYLLEAELDAISLWTQGATNVVSTTTGAGSTSLKGFKQEWYDKMAHIRKIYLVYDADEKGQDGALAIAKRLGLKRCYNIVLPKGVKDVNEFFWNSKTAQANYSLDDFKHLKDKAEQFKIQDIVSSKDSLRTILKRVVHGDEGELKGAPSPWKNVNKIITGVKPGEMVVVAARPKVGKCQSALTVVINPENMMPLTIEQAIFNKQKTIHAYNENTKKIEVSDISDWIDSGVKPLVKLKTRIGRSVETTYAHRYLTFSGWKYVGELEIGEKIAIPTRLNFFGNEYLSKDESYLLGALIADGGLTGDREISYTKKDITLVERTKQAAVKFEAELVIQSKLSSSRPYNYRFNKNKYLKKWLESFGDGIFCLSKHKRIPDRVFSLKKECIAAFISSLWSHDGSVQEKNGRFEIEYSSASEQLIDGLVHLLVRFGINMRKRHKNVKLNGKTFDAWIISSSQADVVGKFLSEFTLVGEKAIKNFKISEKMNRDYLTSYPSEMWQVVLKEINDRGFKIPDIHESVLGDRQSHFKKSGGCSREMLGKINSIIKSELLQSFIESDISFTEIESITDIGEHQCYDLTVPGNENFLANDIVCHNTTMTYQWAVSEAEHGNPVFYICCEMKHDELSAKLLAIKRKDFTSIAELTDNQVLSVMASFPTENLHYWYPFEEDLMDIDRIREKIRETVQRYGCKYVVFDNLQFLTRSKTGNTSDLAGVASRMFKTLAVELDIVIFVVVQPRKTNNNRPLTVDDLKDTSSIFQDLNTLILLHRPYLEGDRLSDDEEDNKAMSDLCQLDIVMRSGPGGRAWLWFNGQRSLFKAEGVSFDREIKAEMDKIKTRMKAKEKRSK